MGPRTDGDGMAADPVLLILPNTHLVVRMPVVASLNPDGTLNEDRHTVPDVTVDLTYDDFLSYLLGTKQWPEYDSILNTIPGLIKG